MTADESKEIREAIAATVIAWSGVESAIVAMVSQCLGDPEHFDMASAIVFAPTSIDARLAIGIRVFTVAVRGLPDEKELLEIAERTFKRLGDSKRIRNAVLHGTVTSIGIGGPNRKIEKVYVRVTPNTFDKVALTKQWKGRQVPGFSAADINQSAVAVDRLAGKVHGLGGLVTHWRNKDKTSYAATLADLRR